ncbi:GntR family transcriptional regulator [Pedobacter hartonius]|uniref:Substrate-binding protein-like domain-containing protein n=1 Tax=Pedobacter hartonius TaxID=425514 RepID=A0A1H4CQQ5_9SPHI|nr:GntR family transcriptional regulator [Pedobacter hartonius]SEA62697.1 substrate-binding protein-like domain-containing protein [Pedobacter hartonius]
MNNIQHIVRIDEYSITPKYTQLINSILAGIQSGEIKKNDLLPSINELSCTLETARSTIERAYNELKRMGLVHSVAGKGFFIVQTCYNRQAKVLLLFNKLSIHKKMIYDAFAATLGNEAVIDFYIYNNDFELFKKILHDKAGYYEKCVIIPHFNEDKELGYDLIDSLPKKKLILMDKLADGVTGNFGAVYEDFENDIFSALEHLRARLAKYHTLKIVFPRHTYHSKMIILGFLRFCEKYNFRHQIVNCLRQEEIEIGSVYINLVEDDLVILIEKLMEGKFRVGEDVGVISYNEIPIKKIILDGITTISTDFQLMGEKTAELVLQNSVERIAIPFKVTLRNSL